MNLSPRLIRGCFLLLDLGPSQLHQSHLLYAGDSSELLLNLPCLVLDQSPSVIRINSTFGIPYRVLKLVGSSTSSRQ